MERVEKKFCLEEPLLLHCTLLQRYLQKIRVLGRVKESLLFLCSFSKVESGILNIHMIWDPLLKHFCPHRDTLLLGQILLGAEIFYMPMTM